jgi:nitroreductase
MDILEAIQTRRSIRVFTDQPVSPDLVRQILQAAMMAPSAGNAQPWQFLVVDDRSILDHIPTIHPYAAMSRQAQVGILVCGDLSREKYPGFWVQDCAAAIQNMLLAAHGLGLGAVWTGIYPDADREGRFREFFRLPASIIPLAFIPIGYPGQHPSSRDRFDPDRIHSNAWGKPWG